jgi:hypothetical protein
MDLKILLQVLDWINLAQVRDGGRGILVKTEMKLRNPLKGGGDFFAS